MAGLPTRPYREPSRIPLSGCHFADNVVVQVVSKGSGDSEIVADLVTYAAYEEGVSSTGTTSKKSVCQIPEGHTARSIDVKYSNVLTELITSEEFTGKESKSHSVRIAVPNAQVKHISLLGLGEKSGPQCTPYGHGKSARSLSSTLQATKAKSCALFLPKGMSKEVLCGLFTSLWLDLTPDNRFKSNDNKKKLCPLTKMTVYVEDGPQQEVVESALLESRRGASGVRFAQELVSAPANYATPLSLADAAREMAESVGLQCKVLDVPEIEALGMGSFLCVGKGSVNKPRFIHLTYTPAKGPESVKKRIALVGKGITFDAGGYNLKVNSLIELMKFDMGGGAAVLGAAKIVGLAKPEGVEAHFIVPTAENLIDAEAYRPGDVITASNGKTIEVHNTDAEGRLILADGLVYADALGVDLIVDIATLTSACMIALGLKIGGVWGNEDMVVQKICEVGKSQGEPLWGMPLVVEYKKELESKIADLKNVGSRYGGSINAALFLKEFVSDKTRWAHIDIAGPCWDHKDAQATGFGARTLAGLVMAAPSCNE